MSHDYNLQSSMKNINLLRKLMILYPVDIVSYTSSYLNVMDKIGLPVEFQNKMNKFVKNKISIIRTRPWVPPYYFDIKHKKSFPRLKLIESKSYQYLVNNTEVFSVSQDLYFRRASWKMKFRFLIETEYSLHSDMMTKTIFITAFSNYGENILEHQGMFNDLVHEFHLPMDSYYFGSFIEFEAMSWEYYYTNSFESTASTLEKMIQLAEKMEKRVRLI